ncbi:MAG: hypothetical protein Aurels2KO_01570 [Aureliella sp.]
MTKTAIAIAGLIVVLGTATLAITRAQDANKYDPELAKELGADEYGMRSYVFCTLVTGETKLADPEKSKEVFAGHFANMERLAKEGKLVLAGPFVDGAPRRGMFIFDVKSIADAEELVKSDPAVAAGVFDYELTKLYCSAALMKVGTIHQQIQKTEIQ